MALLLAANPTRSGLPGGSARRQSPQLLARNCKYKCLCSGHRGRSARSSFCVSAFASWRKLYRHPTDGTGSAGGLVSSKQHLPPGVAAWGRVRRPAPAPQALPSRGRSRKGEVREVAALLPATPRQEGQGHVTCGGGAGPFVRPGPSSLGVRTTNTGMHTHSFHPDTGLRSRQASAQLLAGRCSAQLQVPQASLYGASWGELGSHTRTGGGGRSGPWPGPLVNSVGSQERLKGSRGTASEARQPMCMVRPPPWEEQVRWQGRGGGRGALQGPLLPRRGEGTLGPHAGAGCSVTRFTGKLIVL